MSAPPVDPGSDTRPPSTDPVPPDDDPGHLLTDEEWRQVLADAAAAAAEDGESPPVGAPTDGGGENPAPSIAAVPVPRAGRSAFPSVTGFVQCRYDGGNRPGPPTFAVLHDAETPLQVGFAKSIALMFSRDRPNPTSAHFMVDPAQTIQMLDTGRVAWHCGNGNPRSIGVEQAGYAAFTPGQWSTPDGLTQMNRLAALAREFHAVHGIGMYLMTDKQLRDAHAGKGVGGWATHDQCHRVLGGTTHTDPMPHYPLDQLFALANGQQPPPPPLQEDDDMPIELPAGDHDYVIAVRPTDKVLKLVAFQGNPVQVNMINAMKPNAKGDVDGLPMAEKFELPRFHGPTWNIPDGCTAVVVNYHSDQPISATLYG